MKDEDLRDLFAFGAMLGMMTRFGKVDAVAAYDLADRMVDARYTQPEPEPEEGIVAIKPKRRRTQNVSTSVDNTRRD